MMIEDKFYIDTSLENWTLGFVIDLVEVKGCRLAGPDVLVAGLPVLMGFFKEYPTGGHCTGHSITHVIFPLVSRKIKAHS